MTDEELEQLLPWYVNGTLDATEQQAVDDLLQRSESARQELAFLQGLSEQVKKESLPAPSEMGWRRLRRELNAAKPAGRQQWWKPGLAAAAMVIMALQVMIVVQKPEQFDAQMLGQPSSLQQQNQWLLQIQFNQEYSWQQVTSLMQTIDGVIVDGPSMFGIVRVQVPRDSVQWPSQEALTDWIRQQPGVSHVAPEGQ